MKQSSQLRLVILAIAAVVPMGGCPLGQSPVSIIAGGVGQTNQLGSVASVSVFSPAVDLSISGGTPVEVNWNAVATTNFAVVNVIFDVDQDPENGNETIAEQNLPFGTTSVLVDTSDLLANTYNIGVVLLESGQVSAFQYAPGRILINQRPELVFQSPRTNVAFDRSIDVVPLFEVTWTLSDPDSSSTVQIFLDPDETPNGNEFLLRESNNPDGDSFTFNLPTANFEPGDYRILAIVSDGVSQVAFYAPGRIRIRRRLSGAIDLRELGTPASPVSGAIFEGVNPRDNAGSWVSSLSDYDGDGFSDFVIVSQFGKPQFTLNAQRSGIGEVYMIFGRQERFSGRENLNSTGTLFRGNIIMGVPEVFNPIRPSRGITSTALLSDWDRDGVRELAFGVPFTDSVPISRASNFETFGYFRTGCVVIMAGFDFAPDLGFPGALAMPLGEIAALPHTTGGPDDPTCPETTTFYGPKSPASNSGSTLFWRYYNRVNVGSMRLGCRLSTNTVGDMCGESISSYAFDSLIISVPERDPAVSILSTAVPSTPGAGVVSIFFTRRVGGWPWRTTNAPAANALYAGASEPSFVDQMPQEGPYFYLFDDFTQTLLNPFNTPVITTPGYMTDEDNAIPCIAVHHPDSPQPDGSNTLRIYSTQPGARLSNVKAIDDFNGDGLEDILIGAPFAYDGDGASYIVFGRLKTLMLGAELSVEELALSLNTDTGLARVFAGIQIRGGNGDRLGESQDAIGDFNGDGLSDLALGSTLMNDRKGGVAVLLGSIDLINTTAADIAVEDIPARNLGFILTGENEADLAGAVVTRAGDVDGDGLDDILIAAPNRSVQLDTDLDGQLEIDRAECGVIYLVYGSPDLTGKTISLSKIGTPELPGAVFIGRNSGDQLGAGIGLQGDRSHGVVAIGDVDGDGVSDLMFSSVRASPGDRVEAGEVYLVYGVGQ